MSDKTSSSVERANAARDECANAPRDERANVTRDERANTTRGIDASRRIVLVVFACAYVVLWLGGVGHYMFIGAVDDGQQWLASAFLSVAGLIVLFAATSRRGVLQLVAVAGFGLVFELCGVRYGWPFGRYVYTGVLQPTIFGVPLVMAFAWMVLVAYVRQVLRRLKLPAWGGALTAAVWMTAIDLVIDPLAANQLNYWRWTVRGDYYGIPSSNFAGWFVCSLSIFILFRQPEQPNFWHRLTGASIILFFTLVALSFQLFIAALVGFGLCVAHFLLFFRRNENSN